MFTTTIVTGQNEIHKKKFDHRYSIWRWPPAILQWIWKPFIYVLPVKDAKVSPMSLVTMSLWGQTNPQQLLVYDIQWLCKLIEIFASKNKGKYSMICASHNLDPLLPLLYRCTYVPALQREERMRVREGGNQFPVFVKLGRGCGPK